MAALTTPAGDAIQIVDQVYEIPLDLITVGDRLRPVDMVWAGALGGIMKAEGQKTPIEVCRAKSRFLLVAGLHRLEGKRLEGERTIRAIIVDGDAIARRLREVSENLWRKGLDPIDRAAFVAEINDLLRAKAGLTDATPQQIAGSARWAKKQAADACATLAHAYGFADSVAEQIGLSRRSIYRDLALHRGLSPSVAAMLRGHPVASHAGQLGALAKLTEADQKTVAEMLAAGTARGVAEALATIRQKPKPSPDVKAWSAFFGSWSRMSAAKRREALRELSEQGLPKGVSIRFDDGGAA